jgi:hypothetical protein
VGFTASYDGDALRPTDIALARYNTDGTLDISFSDDVKQIIGFGAHARAAGVVLQCDGKRPARVTSRDSKWDS